MPNIKRRQFLQFAGSTLATLGLSQLDIMRQGDRYAKVLTERTPRKLALLVGINEYPAGNGLPALEGCVNDVRLQEELLIHRFGFNPKDILTLTDKKATRQGILTAFEEHLIKQAKPGDVVVFHFSGHGSQVLDPDRDPPDGLNSTFVPIDSPLPSGFPYQGGTVQDIMGHTLFLLMYALRTENVSVVLDSCHSGGGKRGNFRVRSRDGGEMLHPSQAELEYQRQWLGRIALSHQDFITKRRSKVAKGVVIAAAKRDQFATDAKFNDFSAGAFTYILTQYLWQQTGDESVNRAIVNVGRSTKTLAQQTFHFQEPEFESNLSKENANASIYFTRPQALPAEAVVTKVNGKSVELWLGGLDSQTLEAFNKDAIFTVLDAQGGDRGLVKLESRQGLVGRGKLVNTARQGGQLQPGTLLQERIRGIPRDLTLKIGLDDTSLDHNTILQVKQALQANKRIETLALGTVEVQYIFGGMTEAKYQELQKNKVTNLPVVGSFGLFLPTLDQIIPSSFGNTGETVSAAVNRLLPKFKLLLAARIVKQMLGNTNTSRINVKATMSIAGDKEIVSETFPIRGVKKDSVGANQPGSVKPVNSPDSGVRKLSVFPQIAFQVQNNEPRPLYVSILVIDSQGEMTVIFPNDWSASENAALIEAGQRQEIPEIGKDSFKLTIGEPRGISQALIIASTTPLRNSLKALKEIAKSRGLANRRSPVPVADDILDVTNSLLDDLDRGTRGSNNIEGVELPAGVHGVDVKKLAAMAIAFEVVAV